MHNVVMRVWLPDRPGALGAVASRVGAVRGDLIGIDILERGAGRAIDELIVSLPDDTLVELLIREVGQVDGVDVEEVRPAPNSMPDPRLDALESAAALVEETSIEGLLERLVADARRGFDATWVAVIDLAGPVAVAVIGAAPPASWLDAFVAGSRSSAPVASGLSGPDDVAWAPLDGADLALVLGRDGRPFRARERRQLAALTRIADRRWVELARRSVRDAHPSVARTLSVV
jgi:hypothetical protein